MSENSDLILVTGAAGFLASHIIKQLLESGYRVKGTVRNTKDEKKVKPIRNLVSNPKYPLELCEAELTDEKSWINAIEGYIFEFFYWKRYKSNYDRIIQVSKL